LRKLRRSMSKKIKIQNYDGAGRNRYVTKYEHDKGFL
jgi:hypothetical protein